MLGLPAPEPSALLNMARSGERSRPSLSDRLNRIAICRTAPCRRRGLTARRPPKRALVPLDNRCRQHSARPARVRHRSMPIGRGEHADEPANLDATARHYPSFSDTRRRSVRPCLQCSRSPSARSRRPRWRTPQVSCAAGDAGDTGAMVASPVADDDGAEHASADEKRWCVVVDTNQWISHLMLR